MALRTDNDVDPKLDPGQADYDRKFNDVAKAEEKPVFNGDQGTEDTDSTKAVQEGESNPSGQKELSDYGGWKTSVGRKLTSDNKRAVLKKRGVIGVILAVLGIGGIGFTSLFSGAGLLVNLKEQLANNLMDSVPTIMNARSTQLLQHKLGDMTSGSCSVITIRCKFRTMSDRQIRNFERAGFTVNRDGTNLLGNRSKVTSLDFEGQQVTASNIRQLARENPRIASALNKAFNPRLHAWASSAALKWYNRVGASKAKNITSSTDKEKMKASLRDTMAGRNPTALRAAGIASAGTDPEGNPLYKDADGQPLTQQQVDDRLAASNDEFRAIADKKKALAAAGDPANILKSTVKGSLLIGTGVIDTGCTGWTVVRAAGFAAKYLGAIQMIRYANVYLTTADSIKAGDATPEEVAFLGEILTSQNSAGISGMESRGWNYAMYGDVSPIPSYGQGISMENAQLMTDESVDNELLKTEVTNYVNGQITSDSVMAHLANAAGQGGAATNAVDEVCGFVKSGWGQTIVIGVGAAALVGCIAVNIIPALGQIASGGCFSASTAVQIGIGATIAITLSMLTPWLISLATDTIITGDENGNQAMNAVVSGAGAMNAQVGVSSGAGYLSVDDAASFDTARTDAKEQFAMIDTHDYGPLDASNSNTFLGKLVGYLSPYVTQAGSLSGSVSSMFSLVTRSFSSLFPSVSAKSYGHANVCPDSDYKDAGIATDINCNPIVGQSTSTLAMDIDTVMNYMENGHINPTTGRAMSQDYKNYTTYCLERDTAFGDRGDEGISSADGLADYVTGAACIEGHSDMTDVFRAYQSLLLTNQGMDEEEPEDTSSASGTVVSPVDPGYAPFNASQDFGPRSGGFHKGVDFSSFPGGSLGKPVYAIADGDVIASGIGGPGTASGGCIGYRGDRPNEANNTVIIRHDNGVLSYYLHMGGQTITVNEGDRVTAGQQIGAINTCGESTGAHLHLAIRIDQTTDEAVTALQANAADIYTTNGQIYVNPVTYMALYGVTL